MTAKQFTIEIEIGNDGVQTAEDIAAILRETADKVDRVEIGAFRNIRDINGNTVGLWQVKSI